VAEFYYVYVGENAHRNFGIALRQQVWGWKSAALDKADRRSVARAMRPGDYLVFGYLGLGRIKADKLPGRIVSQLVVTRIDRSLYTLNTSVWPDDVYPERVDISPLGARDNVSKDHIGGLGMEALRVSATSHSTPAKGPSLDLSILRLTTRPGR
jgi:hypothetical protein